MPVPCPLSAFLHRLTWLLRRLLLTSAEYYKCIGEKGEDAEACVKYAKAFRSICPTDWVNKFEEQREEGTWPGKY